MKKAVVVVEDDVNIRAGLKRSLEGAHYTVIAGTTIYIISTMFTLADTIPGLRIRAVVSAIHLNDGICAVTLIRCMEKLWGNGFRSVLTTEDITPEIEAEARIAGLPLLKKPPRLDDLLAAIESGPHADPTPGLRLSARGN